jgi:hypothetical protein
VEPIIHTERLSRTFGSLVAGLTREEVLMQLTFYIELPAVTCALEVAVETFAEESA